MKKLFKYTWAVIALSALTACSSNDSISDGGQTPVAPTDPNAGKELISLAQEGGALTRASLTRTGFESDTKIVMRFKAEGGTPVRYSQAVATASAQLTGDALSSDWCYTDYSYTEPHSHVTYNSGQERYWDDAFGRESQITVYAVAIPNKNSDELLSNTILNTNGTSTENFGAANPNWYKITAGTENNTIAWTVPTEQVSTTKADKDLTYSNNIREGETTDWGRYHQEWGTPTENKWNLSKANGRLAWSRQVTGSTVGKFDQGHLVFKHALAWIEINLTEGPGFNNTIATDFDWTNKGSYDQAITLTGFNTSGNIDLSKTINAADLWSGQSSSQIKQLYESTGAGHTANTKVRKLEGLVIPGTTLEGNTSNLLTFEIDYATYNVSGSAIAKAIDDYVGNDDGDEDAIKAGKHYIINLTVGKKAIDKITAEVVDWDAVNSENIDANNAECTFTFMDTNASNVTTQVFNIYRALQTSDGDAEVEASDDFITNSTSPNYNWKTGYTTNGRATGQEYVSAKNAWKTGWFWESNKEFYHFRAVGINATGTEPTVTAESTNGDYFTMQHGTTNYTGTHKDWLWGAPFQAKTTDSKFKYTSTNGFTYTDDGSNYQISKAIGATNETIHMLLFHMTSQIIVNLTTTKGNDKVTLKNGENSTEVKIVNFLPTGKVRMGSGQVVADGDRNTTGVAMTTGTEYIVGTSEVAESYNNYTYGMVPQSLSYSGGTIGLEITTPDGNKYYVRDLSTIKGTVSSTYVANPYTGSSPYTIGEWYPNFKYTYNITLVKKAIDKITAEVVGWDTVTGNVGNIDLEN